MTKRFEWDPEKATANLRKHGVSFETATRIFADPFALSEPSGSSKDICYSWWRIRPATKSKQVSQSRLSVLFQPERLTRRKESAMKKKLVKYSFNVANPRPLTKKQKAEIKALGTRSAKEIDYSDIPRLPAGFFKNAVRGQFYKPTKTSTTIRIDTDVIAWLRTHGKGYQSRINAILRREMLESTK